MPAFPEESRARGAKGVAVAELVFDPNGDVYRARILEAPDTPIKAAVLEAVKQWKFRPQFVDGSAVYIRGKLTFYYVINDRGEGVVNNPRQVG
jgi:TonB family protein